MAAFWLLSGSNAHASTAGRATPATSTPRSSGGGLLGAVTSTAANTVTGTVGAVTNTVNGVPGAVSQAVAPATSTVSHATAPVTSTVTNAAGSATSAASSAGTGEIGCLQPGHLPRSRLARDHVIHGHHARH